MDNLQYLMNIIQHLWIISMGFKPYYKWITFNTIKFSHDYSHEISFKPYYKWITFNTVSSPAVSISTSAVLNLIING